MRHHPTGNQSRRWTVLLAASYLIALLACPTPAPAASPESVDAAIKKAVGYLTAHEKEGNWEPTTKNKLAKDPNIAATWGGETAIATYALFAAGQSAQDPGMQAAVKWLMDNDLHGTYAVGLRSQVWLGAREAGNNTRPLFEARDRDKDFVLYSMIHKGAHEGFYGYLYGAENSGSLGAKQMPIPREGPPPDAWYDRSNSQYGVLGAWALEQAGAEIPTKYWEIEDAAWRKSQHLDGGWSYRDDKGGPGEGGSTYTMTSAGIATLFITQDYILRANPKAWETCKGGIANANIEKGLAWMDKHIKDALNPGKGGWYYYGLYGIERIGVASGRKYFNAVSWYDVGSEALVRSQSADGSWNGTIHDTCFGLLFLVRGRAPVMLNKLQYENAVKKQADPWNERPRDAANLARWMGRKTEGFLNWQIVNLKVSSDDLHDAPILYISGSEDLNLSNQDMDKLRTFIENGGMILGNADCANRGFATSFQKLGNKLFPKYEFRRLPANHVIFTDEQYHASKWKQKPLVLGLSNGVREMMLLIPDADASRAWQTESFKPKEEMFQLAANIFLYSVDKKNLRYKGQSYIVHPDPTAGGRGIPLARIELNDVNWDPEPGGWPRLAAIMHNENHVDVKPEPVKLGEGKLAAYKIAHLTGTAKLILNEDQRKDLKDFVEKGGTLIIDAAGGSAEFSDSAEIELKAMFGAEADQLSRPLPPESPVFAEPKIGKIEYRNYARRTMTGKVRDPRIRAIKLGDRIGVFYSREDLSAGLVGEPVDGITGYSPEAATAIMRNLVLAASKPK